jgi:hypothetical protein
MPEDEVEWCVDNEDFIRKLRIDVVGDFESQSKLNHQG